MEEEGFIINLCYNVFQNGSTVHTNTKKFYTSRYSGCLPTVVGSCSASLVGYCGRRSYDHWVENPKLSKILSLNTGAIKI